jgi:hypothetical protein
MTNLERASGIPEAEYRQVMMFWTRTIGVVLLVWFVTTLLAAILVAVRTMQITTLVHESVGGV